jgi:hypothetical protein
VSVVCHRGQLLGMCVVLERRKEGVNISELVMDHESKDTHLSGTALVQFRGTLLRLPGISLLVPT